MLSSKVLSVDEMKNLFLTWQHRWMVCTGWPEANLTRPSWGTFGGNQEDQGLTMILKKSRRLRGF